MARDDQADAGADDGREPRLGRRRFLTYAGAGAAAAWTAPILVTTPAAAQGSGPTPNFVAGNVFSSFGSVVGTEWTLTSNSFSFLPYAFAADGLGRLVGVGTLAGAWYSDDAGLTWTDSTTPPDGDGRGVATDGVGNWVAVGDTGSQFWQSTDGGDTWNEAPNVPTPAAPQDVATDGNGTWIAVGDGGGSNGAWISTDNGATWTPTAGSLADVLALAVATDGNGLWVAGGTDWNGPVNNGVIYTSTNNGATWTLASGSPDGRLDSICTDGNGNWVAVGTQGSFAWHTTSPGGTWTAAATPPDSFCWDGTTDGSGVWVAVGEDGSTAWYSLDNGVSWIPATVPGGFTGLAVGNAVLRLPL